MSTQHPDSATSDVDASGHGAHRCGRDGEGMIDIVTSEKDTHMEHWEYYVANVELQEIEGSYTWVCAIGRETIMGLPPLLKRFGMAGWELISLSPMRQTTVSGNPAVTQVEILMATFKRRLGASDNAPSVHPLAPEITAAVDDVDGGRHNAPELGPDVPSASTPQAQAHG